MNMRRHIWSMKSKSKAMKCFTTKIFITTPIFYVNSKPHIGHLYSAYLASAVKQVNLLNNKDAVLSTGTDEHGLKVQQKAKEEKINTKEFCDKNSEFFRALFENAKIDYDAFIRTSDDNHKDYAKKFWLSMMEKGKINKSDYSGFYSVTDESFVPEKDLIKKGDKYYTALSVHSKQPVEYITEQNYQIKFSQEDIDKYNNLIESGKLRFIPNSIVNEVKHYSSNVNDLCVSRPSKRVAWGIEVPNDNEHVIYVWFEALLNYFTVADKYRENNNDLEFVHIIGKDISKFHCYIWPLILLLNNSFPGKMTVLMHNYWLKNETKMSKSVGNVVDPQVLIKKYGADAVRFYVLSAGPLLHDVSFEEKSLKNVFYRNIPDSFINLILRLSTNKIIEINKFNKIDTFDEEFETRIKENMVFVESAKLELLNYNFIQAAHYIHLILLNLNNVVTTSEFWKKTDNHRLINQIACFSLEFLRIVSILYSPFLPELMGNVSRYLGIDPDIYTKFKFCVFRGVKIGDVNLQDEEEIIKFNTLAVNKGYYNIDYSFKSKIFINKVK